ncbi:MAG: CBS domain-containing protein [Methanophagales archaeon ANME-1-THS]|nr:MAG: CBS domain-containing protein [Methanophagales archaeon ANME-1-THS]
MKVREIMSRPVITEDEDAQVSEVVKDMAELGIGSVVITSEGKPVGIITERDIALKVLLANKRASEVKAKEIMSTPLITIEPNASIDDASALAANKRIKSLPVVENGVLVGMVSIGNILTLKPEYVKRFYPEARLLASGWTLDRLERVLRKSEVCLAENHLLSYKQKLNEVCDELGELVGYYVDDKELKDILESMDPLCRWVTGKGEGEKEIAVEEHRMLLNKIVRKLRHTTYLRKQHAISGLSGDLWLGGYRYRRGDGDLWLSSYRSRPEKKRRLPFKSTRPK